MLISRVPASTGRSSRASRSNAELAQTPPPLLPGANLIDNFEAALEEADIGKALLNSLIVSGSITVGTVLCCTLAGFAFAKLRFRGRSALLALTIGTMMIPPQLGVDPAVHADRGAAWVNQLQAVILPDPGHRLRRVLHAAVPGAVAARRADRGGPGRRRVHAADLLVASCCPIARPGMAVLGMLTFVDRLERLLLADHRADLSRSPTVQVALRQLGGGYVHDQSVIMAGTLLGTLPVLLVFVSSAGRSSAASCRARSRAEPPSALPPHNPLALGGPTWPPHRTCRARPRNP